MGAFVYLLVIRRATAGVGTDTVTIEVIAGIVGTGVDIAANRITVVIILCVIGAMILLVAGVVSIEVVLSIERAWIFLAAYSKHFAVNSIINHRTHAIAIPVICSVAGTLVFVPTLAIAIVIIE